MDNKQEKRKKIEVLLSGEVVATKSNKTITVSVERIFQHPIYKKIVRGQKKYLAHDEQNKCKVGDVVNIKLVRPISKRKRWLLIDIATANARKEEVIP